MIELINVNKIYSEEKKEKSVYALQKINLTIKQGEFIGITGPSGCGKTTLMNLIGGLDKPTTGKIYCMGEEITALSRNELAKFRNKKTGFVFQSFYLEPNYSVIRNVMMPLLISGIEKNKREEIAKNTLIELGLEDKFTSLAGELSGGQMQRVSIARALVNNSPLLLADEPTGNLDSKNGYEVIMLLKEINRKGKTVILVTHNEEYIKYCSRIIRLKDGEIVENQ